MTIPTIRSQFTEVPGLYEQLEDLIKAIKNIDATNFATYTNLAGKTIQNPTIEDPTIDTYLPLSGGTMTGSIVHVASQDFDGNDANLSGNIIATGTIYGKGYRINVVAKTAAYTATTADDVITCGAGNETFTVDLPAPTAGKIYFIKNVGTGVITVDANTTGSTTIDGDNTQTVNQYECLMVVSDGTVYWAI